MFPRESRVFNLADAAVGESDAASDAPPPQAADSAPAAVPPSTPEPARTDPEPVEPARTPWFLKRISEESDAKKKALERAEAAEKRAAEALAIAERLQRQPPTPGAYTPPPAPTALSHADIMREAARLRLQEDSTEVLNRGMAQFGPAFQGALTILNAANVVNNDEFVADLIAVDRANAHVMLERLAKEPERAAALASLSSRQRIAELTRMSLQPPAKDEKPTPPGVSKAPAPPPYVAPSSSHARNWRGDDASDDEFDRGFRDMMKGRSRRR